MATEQRLIYAGDLWSDIMMLPHNGDMISSEEVEQAIKDAPTVDAVEVVRCKECQHWQKRYETKGICLKQYAILTFTCSDFYCAYGERRTDHV